MSVSRRRGANEGSRVARRADGRWSSTISQGWEGGKRKRHTVYGATQEAAIEALRVFRGEKATGVVLIDAKTSVADYLQSWLAGKLKLRPSTALRYRVAIQGQLIPHLGKIKVVRLEPEHVTAMLVALQKAGSAPRTVAMVRGVLRAALNDLVKRRKLTFNAAKDAETFSVPKRPHVSRSPAEVNAVLAAVAGDEIENVVTVALFLGCREGETLGLRWSCVDFEKRQLTINQSLSRISGVSALAETKTGSSRRTVQLPGPAVAALQNQRQRQLEARLAAGPRWRPSIPDLVFTDEIGQPLIGTGVTMRLRRALQRAGLPHLRFHDLRHCYAAASLAAGVDIVTVSRALGHSKVSTTADLYTDVMPSLREDAAAKLERLWATS